MQAPKPKKEVKPPPPEPEADAVDAVPVVLRLADGRRINRRFRRTDTVEVRRPTYTQPARLALPAARHG